MEQRQPATAARTAAIAEHVDETQYDANEAAPGCHASGVRWDADSYDRVSDPQLRWGTALLDCMELRGDETVLDAGCGSGRVTELLVARLPRGRAIGLDLSTSMAAKARTRLGALTPVLVADLGTTIPLAAASLDAVFSTATFHWVRDQSTLYQNLATVLRPGGRLVAQCGGAGNISAVIEAVGSLGQDAAKPWAFATPDEAQSRLASNGFTDIAAWLHPEPTRFESINDLAAFLSTCVLNPWLDRMPGVEHEPFARAVASRLPGLAIDYVRLNLVAQRR